MRSVIRMQHCRQVAGLRFSCSIVDVFPQECIILVLCDSIVEEPFLGRTRFLDLCKTILTGLMKIFYKTPVYQVFILEE